MGAGGGGRRDGGPRSSPKLFPAGSRGNTERPATPLLGGRRAVDCHRDELDYRGPASRISSLTPAANFWKFFRNISVSFSAWAS